MGRQGPIWKRKIGKIYQDIGSGNEVRGTSFYTSTYCCPKCGEFLFKARAQMMFSTEESWFNVSRNVFACFTCRNLFTSDSNAPLGGGEYYIMDDTSKFNETVLTVDSIANSISGLRGY